MLEDRLKTRASIDLKFAINEVGQFTQLAVVG
jgi:hypothetical protein